MSREMTLLQLMAERPDDRSLRLAFADWLLEQGDERGEVIALCERGSLSLTERRRVARITEVNARRWLGPLAAVADLTRTRFFGGFVDELVCAPDCSQKRFDALVDEPRLASVRSLRVPSARRPVSLGAFLSQPAMRGLRRLQLDAPLWRRLANEGPRQLDEAIVSGSGVFEGEIEPLHRVSWFAHARAVGLVSSEFVNGLVADEMLRALADQLRALVQFRVVRLYLPFGALEGAVAWLLAGDFRFGRVRLALPQVETWGVQFGPTLFERRRADDGALSHLTVALGREELDKGVAIAAGVLVQLAPAVLASVQISVPPGARLKKAERAALAAAMRRLRSVEKSEVTEEV